MPTLARRRLPVLGVVILTILAGCAGFGGSPAQTTTDLAPNTPETTAGVALTGTPTTIETTATLEAVTGPTKLAGSERHWRVAIINTATDRLSVTFLLDRDGDRLANRTYTLDPGVAIRTDLWAKGNYTITVQHNGTTDTLQIKREDFDCNGATTRFRVNSTTISNETRATALGCGTDDPY